MNNFPINVWKSVPSLRIVIGIITGIIVAYYYPIPLNIIYTSTALVILMLFFLLVNPIAVKFKIKWLSGVVANILFILIGCYITFQHNIENNINWIGHYYPENETANIQLTLMEPTTEKEHFYKAVARVDAIEKDHQWIKATGNVLVYLRKDSLKEKYNYGTQFITNARLNIITNAGNPGSFDYKRYCQFQGITHQVFINKNQRIFCKNTTPSRLYYYLYKARAYLLNSLQQFLPYKSTYGIAEALLIGYRDDLDKELVQAYSNTGVVHIIAISGMHLGMLYGTMVLFFSLFKIKPWVNYIKPITILLVLWGFTLIAGAVPSILRSAFMFSFILLSEIFNKKSNIYNTLSLSALCMILNNPYCIWDVGFQLSYAAVLSIIMFSSSIGSWFYFKHKIFHYLWKMNAVTIAAQVWTFPLIIYYFHQFPRLVIISNLIVVPLSCIILYAEIILLFAGSFVASWGILFGKVVHLCIKVMNLFIIKMSAVSYGTWEGVKVTPLQTILLFVLIGSIISWIFNKSKHFFFIGLGTLLLTLGIRFIDIVQKANQHQLIVYNLSKIPVIEIADGRNTIQYADSVLEKNSLVYTYNIRPAHIENRVKAVSAFPIPYYFIVNNLRVIVLNKHINVNKTSAVIPTDIVIISQNPGISLAHIQQLFTPKTIVIDGTNSLWKTQQLKNENKLLHLPLFETQNNGSFIKEL